MSFPVGVATTTVVDKYLDAAGNPAKGTVSFVPSLSAVGEGITVAPVAVKRTLRDGAFSIDIPSSVNVGLDPDITYEVTLIFDGGANSRNVYQIPASNEDVVLSELVPLTPVPVPSRFAVPSRSTAPASPQPGEMYYDIEDGSVYYWDEVNDAWVDLTPTAPSGPAGGSLTGTYPNPTLAANSVGTAQLADLSVTAGKLSVSYVPTLTYNNDLATTALALGDLEDADTDIIASVALKAPIASPTFTGTVSGVTKAMVGLGNADNTSDADKPVSAATATALNLKAPLASPTFSGTVAGITKTMVGLGSVDNTSDADKPISTAAQDALDLKAPLASPSFTGLLSVAGSQSISGTAGTANLGSKNGAANIQFCGYLDISTAPITGTWAVGDVVMTKVGMFRCTSAGTPGTWLWLNPTAAFEKGYAGWNFDPAFVQAATIIPTGGLSFVFRFQAVMPTISAFNMHATTSAAGVSNAWATLHNDAGAIIGADARSNANRNVEFQTSGFKTFTLITPQGVVPGAYYKLRVWFTTTTALPTLSRACNSASVIINPNQPVSGPASTPFGWASADSGLTDMASAPDQIGTLTGTQTAYWIGALP